MADDWMQGWQPLIERIGTDFGEGGGTWGADAVERGTIRRYLEPLEFDCPLHDDSEVARHHGYPDVIAPYSQILTYTIAPMWRPGMTIFTSPERNAQPAHSAVGSLEHDPLFQLAPTTQGYFATDVELDYLAPAVLGDRLRMVGRKLLAVSPKETRVGRGAFITWESEVHNQRDEVVARMRTSMFVYEPHDREAAQPAGARP